MNNQPVSFQCLPHVSMLHHADIAPLGISTWCRRTVIGGVKDKTHLARVDFLAAEGIVVGTHVGGVDAVPVLLVVRGCRRGLDFAVHDSSLCASVKVLVRLGNICG